MLPHTQAGGILQLSSLVQGSTAGSASFNMSLRCTLTALQGQLFKLKACTLSVLDAWL